MRSKSGVGALVAALALAGCSTSSSSSTPTTVAPACGDGPSHTYLVSSLSFTREGPDGIAPGFNLDGRISDTTDLMTCHQKDFVDLDGVPGIDNQLASIVPQLDALVPGDAIDGDIQSSINTGQILLLMNLAGSATLQNDPCVNLEMVGGKGAVVIGTDGVIEGYQTLDLDPASATSQAKAGVIKQGVMTAGPFELTLPAAVSDVKLTLHLHNAYFKGTFDKDENMAGLLSGGIDPDDIAVPLKNSGAAAYAPIVRTVLENARDLDGDDMGHCSLMSAAMAFKAVPAFVRAGSGGKLEQREQLRRELQLGRHHALAARIAGARAP